MKHRLFELLARHGVDFHGVVQIGASSGQETETFRRYGVRWTVMVEPLDEPFEQMRRSLGGDEGYIPVKALCAGIEGQEHVFHVASNGGQSSSLKTPDRILADYPKVRFKREQTLVSTTVDAILERLGRERPDVPIDMLDVLFMDVQGAELEVLKGASRMLQRAKAVWSEVSYDQYVDGASLEDVQGFLRGFGFRLHDVRLGRLGWGNALFLRRR
jgi:FkbM family methyltransferase